MKNNARKIVKAVDKMRANSRDHRMWKNIPLAEECMQMLKDLDNPKETPLGKALACEAICEQLSEYDVPRLVISFLRQEREWLEQSDEECDNGPTVEEVNQNIQRLEDYIDTQHVSTEEFINRYNRYLKFDPIERTPQWEECYYEVEKECDRRLGDTPRGMGFCFAYWSTLRGVLAERGIHWQSPHEMNPRVMFD